MHCRRPLPRARLPPGHDRRVQHPGHRRGGPAGPPEQEFRFWYQYYFQTERGRRGLQANRAALCRLLWRLWSPTWPFAETTYARTARSFANPDFVAVVIHSYRHRYAAAPGDPRLEPLEQRLAALPAIPVPTLALYGADDGVDPPGPPEPDRFTGPYVHQVLAAAGHNLPQEQPAACAAAILAHLARR